MREPRTVSAISGRFSWLCVRYNQQEWTRCAYRYPKVAGSKIAASVILVVVNYEISPCEYLGFMSIMAKIGGANPTRAASIR